MTKELLCLILFWKVFQKYNKLSCLLTCSSVFISFDVIFLDYLQLNVLIAVTQAANASLGAGQSSTATPTTTPQPLTFGKMIVT